MGTRRIVRAVRYTPEEYAQIQRKAESANLPPATYVRRAALRRRIPHKTTTEAIQAVNRIGVNLNQLTRVANATGRIPRELTRCLEQVEDVLGRLLE